MSRPFESPPAADPFNFTAMSPAVSQVSRSTKTRLRILRRLLALVLSSS